jgi:hypothetical protein
MTHLDKRSIRTDVAVVRAVLMVVAVLAGCAPVEVESGPDAGPAVPIEERCADLAEAACDRAVECYGEDYPREWCVANELEMCAADWDPGEACVEEIAELACGPWLVLPCSCGTGRASCP